MRLLAILIDSWHQARDRRSLLVLSILSGLVVLFCAGLSFTKRSPLAVLEEQTKELGTFTSWSERKQMRREASFAFDASPAHHEPGGALAITLAFRTAREVDRFVREWREFRTESQRRTPKTKGPELPVGAAGEASYSGDARRHALEERFAEAGYGEVVATPLDGEATRFEVRVVPLRPAEVRGGAKVGFVFGAWEVDLRQRSQGEIVVLVETVIANSICSMFGILIALLSCVGFVPDMLQKGTLDLALARPISRSGLLLGKYLGGLWLVAVFATLTVVGSWVALGLRTQYWSPHFLLTILTTVTTFAVLYAIATLVGVWSRSSGLAALAAIGIWMLAGALAQVRQATKTFGVFEMPAWLERSVEIAYTVLPKTSDFAHWNTIFLAKAWLSPEARARLHLVAVPEIDHLFSLGTTALFTAGVLGLACWLFARRDW